MFRGFFFAASVAIVVLGCAKPQQLYAAAAISAARAGNATAGGAYNTAIRHWKKAAAALREIQELHADSAVAQAMRTEKLGVGRYSLKQLDEELLPALELYRKAPTSLLGAGFALLRAVKRPYKKIKIAQALVLEMLRADKPAWARLAAAAAIAAADDLDNDKFIRQSAFQKLTVIHAALGDPRWEEALSVARASATSKMWFGSEAFKAAGEFGHLDVMADMLEHMNAIRPAMGRRIRHYDQLMEALLKAGDCDSAKTMNVTFMALLAEHRPGHPADAYMRYRVAAVCDSPSGEPSAILDRHAATARARPHAKHRAVALFGVHTLYTLAKRADQAERALTDAHEALLVIVDPTERSRRIGWLMDIRLRGDKKERALELVKPYGEAVQKMTTGRERARHWSWLARNLWKANYREAALKAGRRYIEARTIWLAERPITGAAIDVRWAVRLGEPALAKPAVRAAWAHLSAQPPDKQRWVLPTTLINALVAGAVDVAAPVRHAMVGDIAGEADYVQAGRQLDVARALIRAGAFDEGAKLAVQRESLRTIVDAVLDRADQQHQDGLDKDANYTVDQLLEIIGPESPFEALKKKSWSQIWRARGVRLLAKMGRREDALRVALAEPEIRGRASHLTTISEVERTAGTTAPLTHAMQELLEVSLKTVAQP